MSDDILAIVKPVDLKFTTWVDYRGPLLLHDVVLVRDALDISFLLTYATADIVLVDDQITAQIVLARQVDEVVPVADTLVFTTAFVRQFDDGVAISDSASAFKGNDFVHDDPVTLTDDLVWVVAKPLADAVAMADSAVIGFNLSANLADSVAMTEAIAKSFDTTFADSVTMTEALSQGDPLWANVALLLHGDGPNNGVTNVLRDNSLNNYAVARSAGNPPQGAVSPYASGGSSCRLGAAGSNDNVTVAGTLALGAGDFTIETWVYRVTAAATMGLAGTSTGAGGWSWDITTIGTVQFFKGSAVLCAETATGLIVLNTWTHVAVARIGTALTIYVNGVVAATGTDATNYTDVNVGFGAVQYGGGSPLEGFLADTRIVRGTALYTGAFTRPAAPLTPVAGTQVLLNFANGAIVDTARKTNFEATGAVKSSTAQFKYGSASISFAGGSDLLVGANVGNFTLGSGDWTIETWVNPTTVATMILFDVRPVSVQGVYPTLYLNAGVPTFNVSSTDVITAAAALTTGQWAHVAVSKVAGTTRMFINGVQAGGTHTDANNYLGGTKVGIGSSVFGGSFSLNGFLDDVRVTKGVGRYTTNFTPPTTAMPDGPAGPVAQDQALGRTGDAATMSDTPVVSKLWLLNPADSVTMGDTPIVGTTWNPADTHADITLSNNNRTASKTASAASYSNVRGTISRATGKRYFEATFSSTGGQLAIGLANSSMALDGSVPGSSANSCAYWSVGDMRNNGSILISGMPTYGVGDTIHVAVDMDARRYWSRKNGVVNWNNSGTADPATGVGGIDISVGATGALFPVFCSNPVGGTCTLNAGNTAFLGTVPSGFSAWG